MRNLETNSDMLKPGRDPDGYCFYFFISTFNFLITANILKFRHELPESNINSALSSKAAIKGPIVSDFAVLPFGSRSIACTTPHSAPILGARIVHSVQDLTLFSYGEIERGDFRISWVVL